MHAKKKGLSCNRSPLGERNHVFCMVIGTNICTRQHDKPVSPFYGLFTTFQVVTYLNQFEA